MEIQSFKKKKNNKYEIIFKDQSNIDLYDDVIIKYNLLANKKMDNKLFEEIVKYNASLDAYYISLKYLNSKMRTKLEIRKYLEKKKFGNKTINETIEKLENNKAIDESLYIKAFVNDQINFSNIGPNKIINKLNTLGIDKKDSLEYINTIDKNVWVEKLEKLVNKKIKTNRKYSLMMLKNKIITFLYNEGYDKTIIIDVLNNIDIDIDSSIINKEYEKLYNKLSKKYEGSALEYQIKIKLKSKGFTNEEIDKIKLGN